MIKDKIIRYVRFYLSQGYDLQNIKNSLTTAGYSLKDINESIKELYSGRRMPRRLFDKRILIGIVLVVVVIMSLIVVLKIIKSPAEKKILDIIEKKEIGEKIVPSRISGEEVEEETKEEPSLTIEIGEEGCAECDDGNLCTEDVCVNGVCQYRAITPCCGNSKCESGESSESCSRDCEKRILTFKESIQDITNQAVERAKRDSSGAKNLCLSLPTTETTDKCLVSIAVVSFDSFLCESIYDSKERDVCYTNVAIETDNFSLCSKIQDRWLKNSCISFQNLREIS